MQRPLSKKEISFQIEKYKEKYNIDIEQFCFHEHADQEQKIMIGDDWLNEDIMYSNFIKSKIIETQENLNDKNSKGLMFYKNYDEFEKSKMTMKEFLDKKKRDKITTKSKSACEEEFSL